MTIQELMTSFDTVNRTKTPVFADPQIEPLLNWTDYLDRAKSFNTYLLEPALETPSQTEWIVKSTQSKKEKNPIKGSEDFESNYNEIESENPEASKYRRVLTAIAKRESGFNPIIQNTSGAPAYGYFQFMLGNYNGRNYNNIKLFSGLDTLDFLNNPKAQIKAAINLAKTFESSLTELDKKRMKDMGITNNQALSAMWLAGPGGFRKYLQGRGNVGDGYLNVELAINTFKGI